MSRCFPFPPPGYEKKTKVDDADFLKKEKQREKRHKKEKGDREKKEGKEKREKERSDEKHREKKDKKEKHRDKRKDKEDRASDKHKSGGFLPDEKRAVDPSGGHLFKPAEKCKVRGTDTSATLAENRVAEPFVSRNGELVSGNNWLAAESRKYLPSLESKSFSYASELGQRSADEERRIINQFPDYSFGTQSKNNEVSKLGGNSAGPLLDGKEQSKEKASLDGRMSGHGIVEEARSCENASVPTSVGMVKIRVGGVGRPMEKKTDHRVGRKEKIKEVDDRKGDKQKERDRERLIHRDKDREMEKKKEEKTKAISEQKPIERSRVKDGSENHMLKSSVMDGNKKEVSSAQNIGFQNIRKDGNSGAVALDNLGKRKDIGLNGIYDEHTTVPNKLARTTTSTHPLIENGRSLEPCQNSTALAPVTQRQPMNIKLDRTFAPDDSQRPPMNIKVDGKECKINGIVTQSLKQQPSQSTAKAERKSGAVSKPPHPDTKYLREVLSVPKMDEWCDFDDQEWLFNSSSSQTVKPEVETCGTDKTQQVWAKALWLEPVGVYALPYAIPR